MYLDFLVDVPVARGKIMSLTVKGTNDVYYECGLPIRNIILTMRLR